MTKGKFVLFSDGIVYISTEFKGKMDYNELGEEAARAIQNIKTADELYDVVKAFNDEYFKYPDTEVGIHIHASAGSWEKYTDMSEKYEDRYSADYLFVKNETDSPLSLILNGRLKERGVLPAHKSGVLHFGDLAKEYQAEINAFYTNDWWISEWRKNITKPENLRAYMDLTDKELEKIKKEADIFPMSIPRYYASLIDPKDPDDPIRKLCVPAGVFTDGDLDTSGEKSNTVLPGVQHKYRQTVLALISGQCAMYCRHCFRKRFVGKTQDELATEPGRLRHYINKHPEVNNVLLTGGDALMMPTEKLEEWLQPLSECKNLDFIRLGSRTPVSFPERITTDLSLATLLENTCRKKKIYLVTHFNHPKEYTAEAIKAVKILQKAGVVVKNQTVLLKGINDDPEIIAEILRINTRLGIVQHYIFQCRPVVGAANYFQVPLIEGSRIVNAANAMQNGLGKSADYTMSHVTGKIRILGERNGKMLFQYKQAKNPENIGKLFTLNIESNETWLEEDFAGVGKKN